MRRTRAVLAPFIRRYGVKATFRRRVAFVHLADDQAFSLVLALLERFSYKGKLTATQKNMDWFKGFRL